MNSLLYCACQDTSGHCMHSHSLHTAETWMNNNFPVTDVHEIGIIVKYPHYMIYYSTNYFIMITGSFIEMIKSTSMYWTLYKDLNIYIANDISRPQCILWQEMEFIAMFWYELLCSAVPYYNFSPSIHPSSCVQHPGFWPVTLNRFVHWTQMYRFK